MITIDPSEFKSSIVQKHMKNIKLFYIFRKTPIHPVIQ